MNLFKRTSVALAMVAAFFTGTLSATASQADVKYPPGYFDDPGYITIIKVKFRRHNGHVQHRTCLTDRLYSGDVIFHQCSNWRKVPWT
jgi:hypothetical protein